MADPDSDSPEKVVVLNPQSGSGDHVETVHARATAQGYAVEETQAAGDAIDLAREAAAGGATEVVAAGGDGTLNEVVRGVDDAEALDSVTVGVVPGGTGNDFAGNIGITGVEHAFDVLDHGERRRLDLGTAAGRPFVNSCIAGITAEASGETPDDLKERVGVLAYVLTTLREAAEYEGIRLTMEAWTDDGRESVWSGEALLVLIGNGRRFSVRGSEQADLEDGLLEVSVIEEVPARDLLADRAVEKLFGREAADTTRFRASRLELTVSQAEPVHFSLDGEMIEGRDLELGVRPGALRMPVGEGYDPSPPAE